MRIPEFKISDDLLAECASIRLGVLTCKVSVEKSSELLWKEVEKVGSAAQSTSTLNSLPDESEIRALRAAYKKLGKDPSRYRGSAESLIRRLLQGKPLYRINNVVEINNIISIESLCAVGSYDLDRIDGDIIFRVGQSGEFYKGIGKELIDLSGLPLFSDSTGPFGSPTSDSEKAMIRFESAHVATVIISFSGGSTFSGLLDRASMLLVKHAGAMDIETRVIGE